MLSINIQAAAAKESYLAVLLYVIAFLVTTFLHELAHALAAVYYGGKPTLYHV